MLWAVGAYFYQRNADHKAAWEAGNRAYRMCADRESRRTDIEDYAYCRDDIAPAVDRYMKQREGVAAARALVPIPLAWLFVYLAVLIWRWVAKGFKPKTQ